jgi:3',5'-cyclic AMP phosphodiesterase CpdA
MKFIHLSDTHLLGTAGDKLYGLKPAKRLKKAFRNIQSHHADASFIVITGDLTNNGDLGGYQLLKKYADSINIPVLPLMGNHDDREIFWQVFPEWRDGEFVQYVREYNEGVFIFIDTLVGGEEYGVLCDARLQWLKSKLIKYADRQIFLFMHHHPIVSGLHRMDTVANFRSDEVFWKLLSDHGKVRHIFFGHLHRPVQASCHGIMLSSTRSTTFQVSYLEDKKEECLTNTVQPAYSIVKIDDDRTVVQLCEYLSEYGLSRIET